MYFLPVFYTVLQLFLLIAIGFILKRFGGWGDSFFTTLSKFVVRVSLPIYLFIKISRSDADAIIKSPVFLLAAVIIMGVGILISRVIFSFTSFHEDEKRVGTAMSGFGNSGFFPLSFIEIFPITLPLIAESFGTAAPTLYVGTYLIINSPTLWSIGNYLMTGKGRRPGIREIITPPFLAVCVSFIVLLTGVQLVFENKELPFFHILSAFERIGDMTLPLILVSLGAMIANLHTSKNNRSRLMLMAGLTSIVRFLLLPSFFYGVYFLFLRHMDFSPGQIWVLFLETHVPPASNLALMAHSKGINEDYAANTLLVTYGLYMIIFPFYLMLFLKLPGILP